jgi:hypothetical protein
MKLAVILVLALVVGGVQCVASCTSDVCLPKAPPCHKHKAPSVSSCSHELVLERAQTAPVAGAVPVAGEPVLQETIAGFFAVALVVPFTSRTASPPLRI